VRRDADRDADEAAPVPSEGADGAAADGDRGAADRTETEGPGRDRVEGGAPPEGPEPDARAASDGVAARPGADGVSADGGAGGALDGGGEAGPLGEGAPAGGPETEPDPAGSGDAAARAREAELRSIRENLPVGYRDVIRRYFEAPPETPDP
jgi:hypothetical protein